MRMSITVIVDLLVGPIERRRDENRGAKVRRLLPWRHEQLIAFRLYDIADVFQ